MRIPLILIVLVVVGVGGLLGAAGLFVLRKLGMKEPDHVAEMKAGERCEACEQRTVQRTEDGRLSCYGCGHVSEPAA